MCESTIKPLVLLKLNDGTYYYNYNILTKTILVKENIEDENYKEELRYEYIQVLLRGVPSYEKCVLAIIRYYISEDEELALINKHAALQLPLAEISSTQYEEYLELLEEIKYKVKLDFNLVEEKDPIKEAIKKVLKKIIAYDSSNVINSFTVSGILIWLDKNTRAGLKLRFESELALGNTDTILWYEGIQFPLTLENAMLMLYAIEAYASKCYDCTLKHLAKLSLLTDLVEIELYDYTIGYPDKLIF